MKEQKGQPQAQDTNRVQANIETDIEAIPNHVHQQHKRESQYQQYFEYGFRPPEHHYYATYQQTNYMTHSHIHQKHPLPYQNIQQSQQFEDSSGASMNRNYLPAAQKHTHLHEKYNNSQAQKIHQPNQPLSHVHNPIIQRNPQIWEPHQPPPVHYHQQRPSTEEVQKPTAQQTKVKASEVVGRKKLVGSSVHHRSPSAKRPPEAPVTMQGWLNKQGSEGLMLWKKRWFVLSEYCLFYYKGPEEEKLLGSILLPSYEVSICRPEEKISKKYVFKCEHVNMRTYMLAADSQELMMQWVKALTAACTLQISKETETHSDISEGFSQQATIADNFKPSFNPQFHNESLNTTYVPVQSDQSTCNTDRSLSRLEQHQYYQPLYANAPPKPRRISDHFSSPSPDILDRYTPSEYIETTCGTHNIADSMPAYSPSLRNTHPAYSQQLCSKYMLTPNTEINNTERRTPDSYGRSKFTTRNIPHPQPTGYENIYSDQVIYQRPLSPVTYRNVPTKPKPQPILLNRLGPNEVTPRIRKQPSNFVTRPHSADFLEYEISHNQPDANTLSRQPPRPKSSIDIYRNTSDNDNYFYSEERYVEKMRTSAQYLHKLPARMKNDANKPVHKNRYSDNENTVLLTRSNTQPANFDKAYFRESRPVRNKDGFRVGPSSEEIYSRNCPSDIVNRESITPEVTNDDVSNEEHEDNGHFTKSASAKQNSSRMERVQPEKRHLSRESEKKREESMKRLLEWKQKMLQSPLNGKIQGSRKHQELFNHYKDTRYMSHNPLKHVNSYLEEKEYRKNAPQYNSYSSDDEASGSVSINPRENEQVNRDTFPRAKKMWTPKSQVESRSVTNLCSHSGEQQGVNNADDLNKMSAPSDLSSESKKENQYPNTMNISAGDLLGRTHEELVLLLIQLRRQSANSLQAIENCYNEVNNIQYEKGKPLVNLVDQMVKLGSLYRVPKDRNNVGLCLSDRVQFNQQIQERRLLDEEKRQWNKVNPNHFHLQEKVQQLYQLDQLIHEKSSTLQSLKQDKEDTECALGNLRHRLSKGFNSPAEIEQARKQQLLLENKLSWVHLMLAQNSKKLDETIAMNARLEQELLVLKQKLQTTRQHKTSHQCLDTANIAPGNTNNSALLDSNLQRLQYKIGELQKQRQELSKQVRQLTDRPNNFPPQKHHSVPWQNSQGYIDRTPSLWRETDPDTMNNGEYCKNNSNVNSYTSPLYINTDVKQLEETDLYNRSLISSNSTSDNVSNNSNIFQEKQEIKTVRIVKRESENRQSAKEKIKFDQRLGELEDDSSQNSSVLFRPMSVQKPAQTTSIVSSNDVLNYDELNAHDSVPNPKLCTEEEESSRSELSPVFKSDAAQQIITDISNKSSAQQSRRRIVPKEKRRHYTAPNNSSQILPTDNKIISNDRRARDDLDMERALRQKIDAPDIVRSTLSHKELKYNENTIDNILGTPNKINIPERYIPEELPKLSAEEKEYRSRRVESIKKMLYDTAILSSNYTNSTAEEQTENPTNCTKQDATSKMTKEKKQREHLLQLNQILAEQVMEMSKVVAGTSTADEK